VDEPNPVQSNEPDSFLKEQQIPTNPSGGKLPPGVGNTGSYTLPPQYTPPTGGNPVFDIPSNSTTEPGAGPGEKKYSTDYETTILTAIVEAEDGLAAMIAKRIARGEDVSIFERTKEENKKLVTLMEPIKGWIIDKCPAALPLFLYLSALEMKRFFMAMDIKDANKAAEAAKKAEEEAKKSDEVIDIIKENIGNKPIRTSYKGNEDGYYNGDYRGKYIKRTDKDSRLRLEKMQIKDLPKIFAANSTEEVMRWFNIDEKYLKDNGIIES
jgi:hypothetical protein